MADTKKVRSIEERKAAMLAELAELEAKQLEKYRKELVVKRDRATKVDETIAKYTVEAGTLKSRIEELEELIAELIIVGAEVDTDDEPEVPVNAGQTFEVVGA